MDLPPYHHHLHHHHRYVQYSPNFFQHLPPPPQQRLPPPPLPPPHHHRPLPPPPPPRPPPHHQPQFSYAPENRQFFDYRRSPPRVSSNLALDQPQYHPSFFSYNNPPPPSPRFIVDDFVSNCTYSANQEQPVWVRRDVRFDAADDGERHRYEGRRMDIDSREGNYEFPRDRFEGERWEYGSVDDGMGHAYDVRFSNRIRVDNEEVHRLRVDKEEIHRSPPQKKSALLRIQSGKGNHRSSRIQDNSDMSAGGGVRGKQQKDVFERLDRRVVEGRREESPMELNVSFKSNSLVAKAIVATSSPALDSDRGETSRGKKIRVLDLPGSPVKKIGDELGKAQSSGRPLLSSIVVSESNNTTLLSSNGTNDLIGARESNILPEGMVFNQGSNQIGKDGTPSHKIKKTRKKNNKMPTLNKVGIDAGNAVDSSLVHQQDESVVQLVERTTYDELTTFEGDNNLKLPSDVLVGKIERPSELTVVSEDEPIMESNSSPLDSEINGLADYSGSPVLGGPSMLNSEACMVEVQNKPTNVTADNAGNVGGHFQDELCVSKDGITKVSEATVCLERNGDAVLSSLDDSEIQEDDVSSEIKDTYASSHSDLGSSDEKKNAVAIIGSAEAGSVEPSSDPKIVPLLTIAERRPQEAFLDANDSSLSFSSEAGKTAAVDDLLTAECLSSGDPEAGTCNSSMRISHVEGVTLSPEMSHTKGAVSAVVSAGDDIRITVVDTCLYKVTRKRKTEDAKPVLPSTKTSETEEYAFASLDIGKVFSSSREGHASREEEGTLPGNGNDSPKGGSSHEGQSKVELSGQDCLKDDSNSCSAKSPKRRKVSFSLKKRKVPSQRLIKSVSCATTPKVSSSIPITVPVIKDASAMELEPGKTLSNVDDGPPSCPSVILHEISPTKAEPSEEGSMDHFSDVQQVSSQLGATGKENATSVLSVGMPSMGYGVSEDKGSSLRIDQRLAPEDRECHNYASDEEEMLLFSNNLSLCSDSSFVSAMKENVKVVESVPNMSPLVLSPEHLSNYSLSEEPTKHSLSSETVTEKDQNVDENSDKGVESVPDMSPPVSSPEDLPNNSFSEERTRPSLLKEIVIEKDESADGNSNTANHPVSFSAKTSSGSRSSDHKVGGFPVVNVATVSLSSQDTVKSTRNVSSLSWKPNLRASQQGSSGPRVSSSCPSPSFITSRNVPIPKKPLTWHRAGNSPSSLIGQGSKINSIPPQSHLPKEVRKVGSYIRKGNSLVRKPSPVGSPSQAYRAPSSSVYQLNSSGVNELKRKPENRSIITGSPSCRETPEVVNAASERPKTPPKSALFTYATSMFTSLPVVDHPGNGRVAITADSLEVADNVSAMKPSEHPSTSSALPECQISFSLKDNSENRNTLDEGISENKIVYVKQGSNQLVVASDKTQTSSDGYYKRRKNQLIRASSTNNLKEKVGPAENTVPIRRGVKRLTGLARTTSKWSKFSLVWKLGDAQSSRKYGSNLGYDQLRPYLFPWKRASYRRSFLSSSSSDSSISIIRRKLLLAKKRETIYTRSIHGLSLRRSKVLSVSGSSLKWSKSIEQRSKKAAEEAARAVVAVDKRKRGQGGSHTYSVKGNNVSRERIFRIGRDRYKMDPSRKTLQRISGDEEPSKSVVSEVKKSYVPKRLSIGNDEYVRVGNGSKLVRNPKRRVRILASEKVRWSLHTARIRLARKKQYCQFFTRFGKCRKDSGKCPYIHDPSKIAVCTKFLNGSCSDTNCKLTHEVIPERMQDCSYFLQGICSNKNCPYRHVNVNPNAPVCEGFLRGYCADGNECRKKHTYVCPVFQATGSCPLGAKCKLHHPKNKMKGVKRKATSELKNGRCRYFGSPHIDMSERITAGSEKPCCVTENSDIFFEEGRFVDFISLDDAASDEEEQTIEQRSEETSMCQSGPAEMQLDDIDVLIKPMRLINKNKSAASSPFVGSPSEMASSYLSDKSS